LAHSTHNELQFQKTVKQWVKKWQR